jgi:hypothetical protein
MKKETPKHVKYLRSCKLINAGVDFFVVAESLGITMIQAVELMTEDYAYNRFFEIKKDLAESK